MDSGRFETFIDAILAIMMTVMVLQIPQPETMDLVGIWNLRIMYFAYVVSFFVLFSIWDHHRKLFYIIKTIDNKVIVLYTLLTFVMTLLPYFTAWVAHNPYELVPELLFGLEFFVINILYVYASHVAINSDIDNPDIEGIKFDSLLVINLVIIIIGAILAVFISPILMMPVCFITLFTWNIIPFIQNTYSVGDNDGN